VPTGRRQGWLVVATLVGIVLGVPTGLLLAYLAAMPAFLGLFFFLLLGLLLGATMYRLGLPAAPADPTTVRLMGLAVAFAIWLVGPVAEYVWVQTDAAEAAMRYSVIGQASMPDLKHFEERTRHSLRERLASDYPPGGFLGFMQWAAVSRKMELPRYGEQGTFLFRAPGHPVIWVLRMSLAYIFLCFALLSQLRGLGPARLDAPAEE